MNRDNIKTKAEVNTSASFLSLAGAYASQDKRKNSVQPAGDFKICHRCKKTQSKDNFYKEKRHKDGLYSICKECIAKAWKKNYTKNKEKYAIQSRKWRKKNPEKVREIDRRNRLKDINKYRARKTRERLFLKKKSPWKLHFWNLKARCKQDRYYKHIQNNLTEKDIEYLWNRDKAYNLKYPSLDRINSMGDYDVDNCQFIEYGLNSLKGRLTGVHNAIIKRYGKFAWLKILKEVEMEGGDIYGGSNAERTDSGNQI